MTLLFDRRVELHVFLESEKFIIKDLHMEFDILATRDSKPNTASITLYNLSETTRNLFTAETTGIEFWCGYGEELGMVFRGSWDKEESTFKHHWSGADWVTEIETGDGLKEFQDTYFDKSYSSGTPVIQVINDVAAAMGLPFAVDYAGVDVLNSGNVFSAKAYSVLDDLAEQYSFVWSIQHGQIEITNPGAPPLGDATAVLLSPDTGLVGRPTINKEGLELETLMIATIKPNRLVMVNPASVLTQLGGKQDTIKSGIKPTASGVYIVDRIRYHGDNFGGAFNCTINSDLV